jgi:hypothetical protein
MEIPGKKTFLHHRLGWLLALFVSVACRAPHPSPAAKVRITVDPATVVNTMRGGIGASWHAIQEAMPYSETPDPVFDIKSHGGSGWGAYPPADDEAAWQQIDRHARWLGLDWNRVELEERIYEPERGKFTWDSREMKILYRALDWCQKNNADVFLQQMWMNVAWNAYPEWRHSVTGRIHSAPANLEDFGEGLASLLEHLIRDKGYTCIRWLCIVNEPGARYSWWQVPPNKSAPVGPGVEAVRKALDKRGLKIPISAPDFTPLPDLRPQALDFRQLLGAFDYHCYGEDFDWRKANSLTGLEKTIADWSMWTHQQGKPLFLSEFGTMANGWGGSNPAPGSYLSLLKDAELMVRAINHGIDGLNRWSFLNRGDLDGQWQLIDTWDPKSGTLLQNYTPHPNAYFIYGLLSRFSAKHSDVLSTDVEGGKVDRWQRVFATTLRSPKGNLTMVVVNDAPSALEVELDLRGIQGTTTLYRYGVTEKDRDRTDLKLDPQARFTVSGQSSFSDQIAPTCVTVYSTYKLAHTDSGVTAEARD